MPNAIITQLEIEVNGVSTTYDIQDQGARDLIEALGNAVYWIGVTTTELTNGSATNPITVNEESVTAKIGGMAQYNGEEFIWNGSAWQSVGKNNFGALAFKNSATGDFTPQGSVSAPNVSVTGGTTGTVNSITDIGTLPSWTVSGTKATFSAGTLPTKGADTTVVTDVGTITADAPTFTGTQGSVSVS